MQLRGGSREKQAQDRVGGHKEPGSGRGRAMGRPEGRPDLDGTGRRRGVRWRRHNAWCRSHGLCAAASTSLGLFYFQGGIRLLDYS